MANLPVNKKSFNLVNVVSKSFNIAVSGFTFATSLFFRVAMKIPISFMSSIIAGVSSTVRLRRIRISAVSKLIGSQVQTISLRKVRLTSSLKASISNTMAMVQKIPIVYGMSGIVKTITSVSWKLPIDFDPTLATFFTLGYYDPDTLGTWDASTLGDMDYTT